MAIFYKGNDKSNEYEKISYKEAKKILEKGKSIYLNEGFEYYQYAKTQRLSEQRGFPIISFGSKCIYSIEDFKDLEIYKRK